MTVAEAKIAVRRAYIKLESLTRTDAEASELQSVNRIQSSLLEVELLLTDILLQESEPRHSNG